MQKCHPTVAPDYYKEVGNHRVGDREIRTLLNGKENAPDNYRFGFSRGDDDKWATPRHRHPFEQVRLPITGDYSIGKDEILPSGWVGYFPEGAYYGPQVMSENLTMAVLQFGGPSGTGYRSVRQRKQAYADLIAKGGKFENGAYTWTDAEGRKHNKDSAEAIWEQIYGRSIEYPTARFRSLVIMNPAACGWVNERDQPGVAKKLLGTFSEREIKVAFIRLEPGASFRLGTEPAVETLFQTEGLVTHDGAEHPRYTAFATERDEAPGIITARESSEFLYVKLPTF